MAVLPQVGDTFNGMGLAAPSRAAWSVATSNGRAGLLPESKAQVYARVDFEAEELQEQLNHLAQSYAEIAALFNERQGLQADRASHLSAGERSKWVHVLSMANGRLVTMIKREQVEAGAIDGVQHHAQSIEELFRYIFPERAAV